MKTALPDDDLRRLLHQAAGSAPPVSVTALQALARRRHLWREMTRVAAVLTLVVAATVGMLRTPTQVTVRDLAGAGEPLPVDASEWERLPALPDGGAGALVHASRLPDGTVLRVTETAPASGVLKAHRWDETVREWRPLPDVPLPLSEGTPAELVLAPSTDWHTAAGVVAFGPDGAIDVVCTVVFDADLSRQLREAKRAATARSAEAAVPAIRAAELERERQLAAQPKIPEDADRHYFATDDGTTIREWYGVTRQTDVIGVWYDVDRDEWQSIPSSWPDGSRTDPTSIARSGSHVAVLTATSASPDHPATLRLAGPEGVWTAHDLPDGFSVGARLTGLGDTRMVLTVGSRIAVFHPTAGDWTVLPDSPVGAAQVAPAGKGLAVAEADESGSDGDGHRAAAYVWQGTDWHPVDAAPADHLVGTPAGLVAAVWSDAATSSADRLWVLDGDGTWEDLTPPTGSSWRELTPRFSSVAADGSGSGPALAVDRSDLGAIWLQDPKL